MSLNHTPGPWKISWYVCRANRDDVKAGTAKKVGEVLWRVPKQIGPVTPEENHWVRSYLAVSLEDASLIAAAPDLLEALRNMVGMFKDIPTLEQYAFDEPPEPKTQWDYDALLTIGDARAAIAKAEGGAA